MLFKEPMGQPPLCVAGVEGEADAAGWNYRAGTQEITSFDPLLKSAGEITCCWRP